MADDEINIGITLGDELTEQFIKILQRNLISDGKNPSGPLVSDISYRTDKTADGLNLNIFTQDYLKYVDQGRRPRGPVIKEDDGFPPSKEFLRYTNGNKSHAFAIAYKVYRDGIKPTHVIQRSIAEFLNSFKISDQYANELVNEAQKWLFSDNYNFDLTKSNLPE